MPDCHEMGWVRACKGGPLAGPSSGCSGPLAWIRCLGNVAKRVDIKIDWGLQDMRVPNLPDSSRQVRIECRKRWSF